jgi:nucleoid DNA-binding protein
MPNYKTSKITQEVSKKTGYSPALINVVIKSFFDGIRNLIKKNEDIHIKGLFSFTMKKSYRNVINRKGKNFNIRKRKSIRK